MGTTWSEIICDYGMVLINDIRLTEELANDPALFFRKMALYLKNAIYSPDMLVGRFHYRIDTLLPIDFTGKKGH